MKNYKKLLAGILLMSMCISSTLTVFPTKAATKYAAWQYAYRKFIDKKEYESYGKSNNRFHLAYIDGDSIPELVYTESDCHAAGAQVYTFANGKMRFVGEYGEYGCLHYAHKKGRIRSYTGNMGYFTYTFYRMINHRSRGVARFNYVDGKSVLEVSRSIYKINNEEVSRAVYVRKISAAKSQFRYRKAGYDKGFPATFPYGQRILYDYKSLIR